MRAPTWTLSLFLVSCGSSPAPQVTAEAPIEPPPSGETAPVVGEAPPSAAPCAWTESRDLAVIGDPRLDEISGIAASRRDPGVFFVHNDSGERALRFFAVRQDGTTLEEFVIDGAPSADPEDAAVETRDGREWIWLGDVGDNAARDGGRPREGVAVVRAEVPALEPHPSETAVHVDAYEVFELAYPDGPHDCEALVFDAASGDLYLLSKENEGPHHVFRDPAPHDASSRRVLEHVIDILPGRNLADAITGADADAAGRFVVRTYRRVYLFSAPAAASPLERWATPPLELPVIHEYQGESIAFGADGHSLYSVAEGERETLHGLFESCPR